MRTFVVSDIHGKNELFDKAMKEIGLKRSDKLILLGDLIDRGDDSKGVLDSIIRLKDSGYDISGLMGNHEQMLLDSFLSKTHLSLWLLNGGYKTLASFSADSIEAIPQKYIELIKSFNYYIEHELYIFVHAALNMKINEPYSDKKTMLWDRNAMHLIDRKWLGNRKLIHGHTPEKLEDIKAAIANNSPVINLDNGVYFNRKNYGALCIFELESAALSVIQ